MALISNDLIDLALKRGILLTPKNNKQNGHDVLTRAAAAHLLTLGFIVDPASLPSNERTLNRIVQAANRVSSNDRAWNPMYPNFPEGVRDTPTLNLFVDQIIHYLSDGTILPDQEEYPRKALPVKDMILGSRKVTIAHSNNVVEKIAEDIQIIIF